MTNNKTKIPIRVPVLADLRNFLKPKNKMTLQTNNMKKYLRKNNKTGW